MKAAVKVDARKELMLTELAIPEIQPDEALIKIITTSICGTDVAVGAMQCRCGLGPGAV